jgi:hypothetical protein
LAGSVAKGWRRGSALRSLRGVDRNDFGAEWVVLDGVR